MGQAEATPYRVRHWDHGTMVLPGKYIRHWDELSSKISDPDKGVFGIGEHSDFSMLSFLAITGELPGLQILLHGEWIDVPPRRGAFICNVGDMLQRWTNNHLRSTMHRVVNKLGRERYSIPFFLAPDFDTEVACLPQFCSEDNPPKYPLTTSGKYLSAKLLGLTSEEGEEK